jgi:hypothetical protein
VELQALHEEVDNFVEVVSRRIRQHWAESFIESVRGELASLSKDQRLCIVIDTRIANLDEHAHSLMLELEALAEREGFGGRLDIIMDGYPVLLGQLNEYVMRNENAVVRGIIRSQYQRQFERTFNRMPEPRKHQVRLVSVEDAEVPNTDSNHMHYVPLLHLVNASLTGTLEPTPYASSRRGEPGSIIAGIITLQPVEPIPMSDLEMRLEEDAVFLRNA